MVDGLYGQNGEVLEAAHTIVLMEEKCRNTLNTVLYLTPSYDCSGQCLINPTLVKPSTEC